MSKFWILVCEAGRRRRRIRIHGYAHQPANRTRKSAGHRGLHGAGAGAWRVRRYAHGYFSFGAVLYEMVAGSQPFRRDTAAETMTAILKEEPPELSEMPQPALPGVQRIIARCLERNLAERFQSRERFSFRVGGPDRDEHEVPQPAWPLP